MAIDLSRLTGSTTSVQSSTRTGSTKDSSTVDSSSAVSKTTATASGEAVHLSDEAQKLQQISENLRDQPTVNSARVEALKASIADGSYKVDSARVAQKLTASEASLA